MQVEGKVRRRPVADYLRRQGRFDHFADEDLDFFQSRIDEMWEDWILPGVLRIKQTPLGRLPTASSRPQASAPGPEVPAGGHRG
jgi:hypothetical protein